MNPALTTRTEETPIISDAPEGPRILGTLRAAAGTGIVRIEDRIETGIDDLWSALTDPDRLAGWYGQVEGDLRAGGRFRLSIESNGWDGTGRVEACEPPQRLVVTTRESDESWRSGQGAEPFDETIEATLTGDRDRTALIMEIRGLPLDKIAFYGAGWQIHVEHLAAFLAGHRTDDAEGRWGQLVPAYQALASTIG